MNVQLKSRLFQGTGMALMLVSSLAACSPGKDSAPKANTPQAQEQDPVATRPTEPSYPNGGGAGADMLVAYEIILDDDSAVRINRGGQYEALEGQTVRRVFLDHKDVEWIQASLLDLEYRYGRAGLQSASLECSQLAAATEAPATGETSAPPAEGGTTAPTDPAAPVEGGTATPVPAPAPSEPVVDPAAPRNWGIRAVRVQSLLGLAPVIFSRNESVRCLFQGLSSEGFDARFEEGLGRIVEHLAPVHQVAQACADANIQFEQAMATARGCQVDTDCAWVDSSFHPVWNGELEFITSDDCSAVSSPLVGNAQAIAAYSEVLKDLHGKARAACGTEPARASCGEATGFQASDFRPACLAGACVYGPLVWEPLSVRPRR